MEDLFSHRIYAENISFKHARGVSDRSGKEFHIYHELILFLDGDAEFISEDLHMRVKPETLIVIPKETYHQMVIHGNQERYYRCVLQFDGGDETAELTNRPFHVGVQFHPEFKSRPNRPHPLFTGFIAAALKRR